MLSSKNNATNDRKRRTADRSFMIRDNNCPDCQRPWKVSGSTCSRANRSVRMSASTPMVACAISQRRTNHSSASVTPSAVAAVPSTHSSAWSRCSTGPSITALVISGITTVATKPSTATVTIVIHRAR